MKSNLYNQFPKSLRLFSSAFFLIASTLIFSAAGVFASTSKSPTPLTPNDKPVEEVIADLQDFIPRYLQEQSIPGVAIALIRQNKVV